VKELRRHIGVKALFCITVAWTTIRQGAVVPKQHRKRGIFERQSKDVATCAAKFVWNI
jgi:hypothetical protein